MKYGKYPSQYELCRIAGTLFGPAAAMRPTKAVRAALGLWFSAGYELTKVKQRTFDQNVAAYSEEGYEEGDSLEDVISDEEIRENQRAPYREEIRFGDSIETSDAMRWVNTNAPSRRDQFKSFGEFERAWIDIYGDGTLADGSRLFCSTPILKKFMEERLTRRKAADAARKRKKRSKQNSVDSLSKRIADGQ